MKQRLSDQVAFRVTRKERREMERLARSLGMTLSEWARSLARIHVETTIAPCDISAEPPRVAE